MASKKAGTAVATATDGAATAVGRPSLVRRVAAKFHVDDEKMLTTLKQTAFRVVVNREVREPSNEQMMALLIIADQYNLNPWTKEIYAFPDKFGGIVPVVGVDGWLKMINQHPQFDSMELAYGPENENGAPTYIECSIKRKDRGAPTLVREYLVECYRDTDPWRQMPSRMLRHKAIIQCGRVAFGYAGINDPDDGDYLLNAVDVTPRSGKPETESPRALPTTEPAKVSESQIALLTERLQGAKLSAASLCEYIGVETLGEIRFESFNSALDWINANAA